MSVIGLVWYLKKTGQLKKMGLEFSPNPKKDRTIMAIGVIVIIILITLGVVATIIFINHPQPDNIPHQTNLA